MSTTFDVYPRTRGLPSFRQLLDSSTSELHRFLGSVAIRARPSIHMRLHRKSDNSHLEFEQSDPLRWGADTYAWFMVGEVPGGTDAYFGEGASAIREMWEDKCNGPQCEQLEPLIRECLDVGHYWSFRRSAGQPAVISLAYGLIAGSLAALTGGFLNSGDSGWESTRLPAQPQEFLGYYFRPEHTLEPSFQDWSRRCLASLAAELDETTPPR